MTQCSPQPHCLHLHLLSNKKTESTFLECTFFGVLVWKPVTKGERTSLTTASRARSARGERERLRRRSASSGAISLERLWVPLLHDRERLRRQRRYARESDASPGCGPLHESDLQHCMSKVPLTTRHTAPLSNTFWIEGKLISNCSCDFENFHL